MGDAERRRERRVDEVELTPVVDRATVLDLQRAIEEVHVAESIGLYMVDVVASTRQSRAFRWDPARAARSRSKAPAAWRRSAAATSSRPRM